MAKREINGPKARPAQAETAPEVGHSKGRLTLERRIDVTYGVAYTSAEFVDRFRSAEERRSDECGLVLTEA